MSSKLVHVAIAVLLNAGGDKVLLTRRHQDAHQGGRWEFPGGKVDSGETVEQALVRELDEELGICPLDRRPLIRIRHQYPEFTVVLDTWLIHSFSGEPKGREAQPLQWVAVQDLDSIDFPEANQAIVRAVQLPDRYVITPYEGNDFKELICFLNAVPSVDRELVQIRLRERLPNSDLADLVAEAQATGSRVMLNGPPELALEIGADGVHLSRKRLFELSARPLSEELMVAASCHDALALEQAQRIACDFVVLSPVAPTRSHPQAQPLGWRTFRELTDQARLPVYALGGMGPADRSAAWQHGAQGVAGISGFWPDVAIEQQ